MKSRSLLSFFQEPATKRQRTAPTSAGPPTTSRTMGRPPASAPPRQTTSARPQAKPPLGATSRLNNKPNSRQPPAGTANKKPGLQRSNSTGSLAQRNGIIFVYDLFWY